MKGLRFLTLLGCAFIPLIILSQRQHVWIHISPHDNNSLMREYSQAETAPIIFIGGFESSGTGLMRIILDAHPWIRCGAEPMVTSWVLSLKVKFTGIVLKRSISAGVFPDAFDNATAAFILELIKRMGPPARLICHKQPMSYVYLDYLAKLFPSAKFIHMVRDGRAAIASSMSRNLLSKNNCTAHLNYWNKTVSEFLQKCQFVGVHRCLSVRYERLVMYPKVEIARVLKFLDVPWDPIVLRHETIVANLTNITPYEPSTKQFVKKIHQNSLGKWALQSSILPQDFIQNAHLESRLLQILGYANVGIPPKYESISSEIPFI